MSEKLMAGVLTAVVIAPVCSVCILGPAVIGSFFGGFVGWFSGLDPSMTIGLVMAIAVGIHTVRKKRPHETSNGPVSLVSSRQTSPAFTTSD